MVPEPVPESIPGLVAGPRLGKAERNIAKGRFIILRDGGGQSRAGDRLELNAVSRLALLGKLVQKSANFGLEAAASTAFVVAAEKKIADLGILQETTQLTGGFGIMLAFDLLADLVALAPQVAVVGQND